MFVCLYVLMGFRKCSYSGWLFCSPMFLVCLIMYVGLLGHSAVVFHVFYVLLTVCVVAFFSVTFY